MLYVLGITLVAAYVIARFFEKVDPKEWEKLAEERVEFKKQQEGKVFKGNRLFPMFVLTIIAYLVLLLLI